MKHKQWIRNWKKEKKGSLAHSSSYDFFVKHDNRGLNQGPGKRDKRKMGISAETRSS